MSFENGYNIEEYIGKTIEEYKKDKNIFSKALMTLNIFMQRKDWPMCFNEFEKISHQILKTDPEWICRTINMFHIDSEELQKELKGWEKDLEKDFLIDVKYFVSIMDPIINEYYDYVNNPLGISNVIEIDKYSNLKIIRINRNDGENFDLRVSDYEINQLISTLNGLIGER